MHCDGFQRYAENAAPIALYPYPGYEKSAVRGIADPRCVFNKQNIIHSMNTRSLEIIRTQFGRWIVLSS